MDSKVNVKGDVDVVMDQNVGSITINNYYGDNKVVPAIKPELRRAIGELLGVCDPCGQRKLIEKISLQSFNTTDFKSLKVEQVQWLIDVAHDIANSINNAVIDQKRSVAREEKEFQEEYGILASEPAREALKLLVKQNLTTKQVAIGWKSGMLRYEDDDQFSIHQSRLEKAFGMFMLSLAVIFSIPVFFMTPILEIFFLGGLNTLSKAQAIMVIGVCLSASLLSFWAGINTLAPHHTISYIAKHLNKVNDILRQR